MQLITLYRLKKTLIWAGSLASLATMAFGVFLYSQKLSKKDTAPLPSEASQNACYLEFTVEGPPSNPPTARCVSASLDGDFSGNTTLNLNLEYGDPDADLKLEAVAIVPPDHTTPEGCCHSPFECDLASPPGKEGYFGAMTYNGSVWGVRGAPGSFQSDCTSGGYCGGEPYCWGQDGTSNISGSVNLRDKAISFNANRAQATMELELALNENFPYLEDNQKYQVWVLVRDNEGNANTSSGNWEHSPACDFAYSPPPPPPPELSCVSLTASPTSGDSPLTVSFTATPSDASLVTLYRFTFGDGNTVETASATATHTYQQAGSYTASVQMRDGDGNWTPVSSNCQTTITVDSPPPPPELSCVSLTASPTSGDYPLTVTFTATASDEDLVSGYIFDFGNGDAVVSLSPTATMTYQEEGTYYASVTLLDLNGRPVAVPDTCKATITVTAPPPPPPGEFSCVSLTASETAGQAPLEVEFSVLSSDSERAESYRFFFGDGQSTTTSSPTVTHTYATAGTYTAYVLIKDSLDGWTEQVDRCSVTIGVATPPAPPEELVCNSICSLENDQCPSGLTCVGTGVANYCRNPQCSSNADCSCSETAQETPEEEVETPPAPVEVAQTPSEVVIPDTGFIGNTLKVVGAGLILLVVGLIL